MAKAKVNGVALPRKIREFDLDRHQRLCDGLHDFFICSDQADRQPRLMNQSDVVAIRER